MEIRRRRRFGLVVLLAGVAALACGSGSDSADFMGYRGKSAAAPGLPLAQLHDAYRVPPDRALIGVRATLNAAGFDAAANAVRTELEALQTALSDAPGCSLRVLDYGSPRGDKRWSAPVEAVVDVDLAGLETVEARMDRLDRCTGAVAARAAVDEEIAVDVRRTLTSAPPVLVVDDPESHVEALLARHAARYAAVAGAPGAPQLHPEDLRCVPNGDVEVGQTHLSGVELRLGVSCRIVGPAADPPDET